MKKELFIEAIEAIKKQIDSDVEVSKHLGRAFPNAFEANLLPDNRYLHFRSESPLISFNVGGM